MKDKLFIYTLRLADDGLILGHRLAEWCSRAPFIEEDLALTNVALDMIGRSQALLKYANKLDAKNRSEDYLAYRRGEKEYFNHLITEQPNGDFAHTIARQFYISSFEYFYYEALENSKDPELAAIAARSLKEIRYHLEHARDWVIRLGDGTPESHIRMQKAVNDLWMYTGELFEMDEVVDELMSLGIAPDPLPVRSKWEQYISHVMNEATVLLPNDTFMQSGSSKGVHTENLGHILSEMQYLQRAYPDAEW